MSQKSITGFVASLALALLVLPTAVTAAAEPRSEQNWCGTQPGLDRIAFARYDQFESRRAAERSLQLKSDAVLQQPLSRPTVELDGDVVVIIDDGTIIQEPNQQDVANKGWRFTFKKKKGYKIARKPGVVSQALGRQVNLSDDDSARVPFEKGFTFKFFGTKYNEVFINSDGNLTFGEGDSASTSRDLGRTLNGPARVMAYFTDLNPETGGDVYVNFLGKGKMQVTWLNVPEFGGIQPNTFQVVLSRKGHVEFRFGTLAAASGIVGISPGRGAAVRLLDLTEDAPTTVPEQAIAEVYGDERTVDEGAVARTFYANFPDDVEQIVLYYDFPLPLLGGQAVAYHFSIKNNVKGIGYKNARSRELFDNSASMGSDGVLEGFANMGYVQKYSDNLNRDRSGITDLGVLVHEIGHQWMSRIYYRQGGRTVPNYQEGTGHWAFVAHTQGSFMQGHNFRDNGDGSFTSIVGDAVFSEMDLYMMGMAGPEAVTSDLYWVDNSNHGPSQLPQPGVTIRGDRTNFTVQDVIREEGPRVPSVDDSPKVWRVAMILLVSQGQSPNQAGIDKVQLFADRIQREWRNQTDGVGSLDFTLTPN